MKKVLLTALLIIAAMTASAQSSKKVVVDSKGNAVGFFVREKQNTYVVSLQDDYEVPKAGHKVVTYSAANGQGVIFRNPNRTGNINVRKQPNVKAPVVAKIPDVDCMMDPYPCLGKENNWYKIRIDGKVGYVREDMANWEAINTQ